ncbi:MAG: UbiD family decarboxylase, partial [Phycisphaerales bacterium]|nr:UbiD family decarboxylase [Phycisphaerales bacterium]
TDPAHAALGGRALLFEHVQGCDFPLAINIFGSYHRMELALGCAGEGGFQAIADRIASLTKMQPPRSLTAALAGLRSVAPLMRIGPRRVRKGRCQEIVKLTERGEVDLRRLPLLKCWPLDGDPAAVGCMLTPEQAGTAGGDGRYITFAGMHTIHADDADADRPSSRNIGMYRAQLVGATHLAMHWHIHHDGAHHWRSWKKAGQRMPIAICFGGEPVLPYAATAPLPPGISELLLAGFLSRRGIPLVRAKTVPIDVPASSEIVIEGWVSTECAGIGYDPARGEPLGPGAVFEGPFGDHTGFYSLPDRYPVVEVTAITHRKDAILPATIVGPPPQEDYYLGKATERIFAPLLRTLAPDIDDYDLPMFGCFHNCVFVRIRKAYPLHARKVMHAVWGAGQLAWTKFIVVVDEEVDVHDCDAVLRAVFMHCNFHRDVQLVTGPLDILDHAAPSLGAGTKIGIDATRKIPGEEVNGIPIDQPGLPDATSDAWLQQLIGQNGIVNTAMPDCSLGRSVFLAVDGPAGRAAVEAVLRDTPGDGPDLAIAVDASVDVRDIEAVLFHLCASTDPGRDMVRVGNKVGFDATMKGPEQSVAGRIVRQYPPRLVMDEQTRVLVDRRWSEYGF